MHILTGLLFSGLAGFNKGALSARGTPPRIFTGPVKTVHALPGRIRFSVPSIKGNPKSREVIMARLPFVKGVRKVQVNVISGSVLILFDEEILSATLLFASVVRLLRLDNELDELPPSLLNRELREVLHSLNLSVFDKTCGFTDLWTALAGILGFYGVAHILSEGSYALPDGGYLLLWALNLLKP